MDAPQQIDRYEVRSTLGSGAMGAVHLAWDPKLHREVAIKVLRREVSNDAKIRMRFTREARAVAALRHPNVVEIYDYSGEESELLYIVMEKLDGDDLFNIVAEHGSMPEPIAVAVGHELCLALGVAHEAGIIHRDLKPENVFVSPNGRVVLTDFGIVKAIEDSAIIDGAGKATDVIGTPGFMPPELMMNKGLGPYTDVFALGALVYNIATGKLPYDGPGPVEIFRAMMAGKFEDPRVHNQTLSEELCAVLAGTLEPKPKKRTQTVAEVREALKGVLANCGVTDLRDDMREYMADPKAYWETARQRTARHLVQRIKIATKDKDFMQAENLRLRLITIDPENQEVQAVSGLMPIPGDAAAPPTKPPSGAQKVLSGPNKVLAQKTPGSSFGGKKLLLVGGLLATGALAVALVFVLKPPKELPKEVPTVVEKLSPVPAAAAPAPAGSGQVEVVVKAGVGQLFVDGERIGRVNKRKTLSLESGAHEIEVRSPAGKLKKTVSVAAGDTVTVSVDLKKKSIELAAGKP